MDLPQADLQHVDGEKKIALKEQFSRNINVRTVPLTQCGVKTCLMSKI